MASLTPDALWIQDTWQLRRVAIHAIDQIETLRAGNHLTLTLNPENSAERLQLTFATAQDGQHWCKMLELQKQKSPLDPVPCQPAVPEGVSLVQQAPDVSHEILGRVGFRADTARAADRGLQLRAALRGADAVINVQRQKCPEGGWSAYHASGSAIRVEDADSRQLLRRRWYNEETRALVKRLLLLLVLQGFVILLVGIVCAGASSFSAATGETPVEALASLGMWLGMLYAWPLVLLALWRFGGWPVLLRPVGLAVLTATSAWGLVVLAAHGLAVWIAGGGLTAKDVFFLADPVAWALIITGLVLTMRAWRLGRDATQILPNGGGLTTRTGWSVALLGVTAVYALVFLALAGTGRYQVSAYLMQPGIDSRREQQAMLALNEGAVKANKGDLDSAEKALQRSLRLWEELTSGRSSPPSYRRNLAMTLNNLGWIRHRQNRFDEAEKYYARAVALADELAGDPQVDEEFKQTMREARQVLAEFRNGAVFQVLDEKDKAANRKYEEAQVLVAKGDVAAERLYREAIALWEEVLPQATNEEYRKDTVARLALAYLRLGELQQQQGNPVEAAAALRKSIDWGENAVSLDPGRPLTKHNLETARQRHALQREQTHQDEIAQLCGMGRFADAVDACLRGITEQEDTLRSGKDREAATRLLAYRLDRFAMLLAHCPDGRVRDTKTAVKNARRATQLQPSVGDYTYTLAVVQYRNGDWRDSLASLDQLKFKEGSLDGFGWLLTSMNLQQLKRREEARTAFRKAAEWIGERTRQAEDNPLLRFQFEMIRPGIEALRREAENLIEGKDPGGTSVG